MDERLNGSNIIKSTSFLNAFFTIAQFLKIASWEKNSLASRGILGEPTEIEILPFATKLQNLFFFLSWLSDMRFQIVFFIMIIKITKLWSFFKSRVWPVPSYFRLLILFRRKSQKRRHPLLAHTTGGGKRNYNI